MFTDLKQHGNTHWKPDILTRVALLWTLSERNTWRRRFKEVMQVFPLEVNGRQATFEGFRKALRARNDQLLPPLKRCLREAMLQFPATQRQTAGWDVFAVDGTRMELPRTLENQKHFCADYVDEPEADQTEGHNHHNPQMWLTTLWHVGLSAPWDWRTGPGNSSERDHLRQMIGGLPEGSLLVADAGFVGYDLWKQLENTPFLIRCGSSIHLINDLQETGDPTIYCYWPIEARQAGKPPMRLRLIQVQIGKETVYLLTNVLDASRLSDEQARAIYLARWGIELFYRGLKQTLGCRRLLGRTPDSAQMELDWSLMGLWMIHLLAAQASSLSRTATESLPARSTARLLDAIRDVMHRASGYPDPGEDLASQLRNALLDGYQRKKSKKSRNYPRKNKHKRCGAPNIRAAKPVERRKLERLKLKGQLAVAV